MMRGFWAVILFSLGLLLAYPGMFIWQIGIVSMLSLACAISIAIWSASDRSQARNLIFAWMCGFVLIAQLLLRAVTGLSG